jgi:hypothetical protein
MGELSRLVWLMGFVKHALWVDSLYFLRNKFCPILSSETRSLDDSARSVVKVGAILSVTRL